MRRLPSELLLDHAITARTVTVGSVRSVGKLLAEFYLGQSSINISADDYLRRIGHQVETCRAALLADDLGLPAELASATISRQQEFLKSHSSLFVERALRGKIIEAHGDLKPEHIYLGKPPCVIDCLEFDRDLRIMDPLEELAFLSVECRRLGEAWIGPEMTRIYAALCDDSFEMSLFDFYRSRRAAQRAVTAAWHLRDPRSMRSTDWRARATSYLNEASEKILGAL
jgi:aminoglycoside phosphotransferase family enzyme